MKKLLIVGPDVVKHGIGGVTIHVRRLRDYLEKLGIAYAFVDYKYDSFSVQIKALFKSEIVHYNVSNPIFQFVLVLCSRIMRKKVIMTLHGNYGRFGSFKNFLVKTAVHLANIPVVINEMSYLACKRFNENTQLIPAFIPPQREEVLQKEILTLVKTLHNKGRKIVSTNAFNVAYDKDGNEIYGIDFLVKYFKDSSDMALLISDPTGNYHKMYEGNDTCSVFFVDFPHPYFELLKHVDYFVRNTSTDGDALSVKEALYLRIPTLCTDVVDRPKGVRLFKYCDRETFEKCLLYNEIDTITIEGGAERIVRLYDIC